MASMKDAKLRFAMDRSATFRHTYVSTLRTGNTEPYQPLLCLRYVGSCPCLSNYFYSPLTPDSIQEALRMYFQPIKNDDAELDLYTMYKRETTEYDTEYMQKYNEDLNITLIFVRFCFPFYHYVTSSYDSVSRPVCSPRSAPPSSSTFSRNSSQTPGIGQKPTSGRFFSASTDPSPRRKSHAPSLE